MTEVVTKINDHAFNELGFEVLYFGNAIVNVGYRKKTGAVCVGTREFKFVAPDVHESESWKLTKEAWSKCRGIGQSSPI